MKGKFLKKLWCPHRREVTLKFIIKRVDKGKKFYPDEIKKIRSLDGGDFYPCQVAGYQILASHKKSNQNVVFGERG